MKYMGSKRAMLLNGLGDALHAGLPGRKRFVDLFTGSAAVAWHVAKQYDVEVIANDLQQFSVVLASSVLSRTSSLSPRSLEAWFERADTLVKGSPIYLRALALQKKLETENIETLALRARELSTHGPTPMVLAYGGYYFSPLQALTLDALRASLPRGQASGSALASLVWAASKCAASPGHTAQPFKANRTAGTFLKTAWQKDVVATAEAAFKKIGSIHSRKRGSAVRENANTLAKQLRATDLVFLDPPYSGVHYSRFYHVLETLVGGQCVEVSGTGRYPPADRRPRSQYSLNAGAKEAFTDLMASLSDVGCDVLVTFPAGSASNGLTGQLVTSIARKYFKISSSKVSSRFSTLGGNRVNREARHAAEELILTLTAR
ncbi:adenine-specific DNA-methyltransferase [Bradyrhizobium japonicum]